MRGGLRYRAIATEGIGRHFGPLGRHVRMGVAFGDGLTAVVFVAWNGVAADSLLVFDELVFEGDAARDADSIAKAVRSRMLSRRVGRAFGYFADDAIGLADAFRSGKVVFRRPFCERRVKDMARFVRTNARRNSAYLRRRRVLVTSDTCARFHSAMRSPDAESERRVLLAALGNAVWHERVMERVRAELSASIVASRLRENSPLTKCQSVCYNVRVLRAEGVRVSGASS